MDRGRGGLRQDEGPGIPAVGVAAAVVPSATRRGNGYWVEGPMMGPAVAEVEPPRGVARLPQGMEPDATMAAQVEAPSRRPRGQGMAAINRSRNLLPAERIMNLVSM